MNATIRYSTKTIVPFLEPNVEQKKRNKEEDPMQKYYMGRGCHDRCTGACKGQCVTACVSWCGRGPFR